MANPRVIVLRAPGINCEEETVRGWEMAGARCDLVHLDRVVDQPQILADYAILTVPGGFSFGDDIAAGRIAGNRMRLYLTEAPQSFLQKDRLLLGICNGFQILVKAGLLAADDGVPWTLASNACGHYLCRWVTLQAVSDHCRFLEPDRSYFLPMAHAEGRVASSGRQVASERIALRYVQGMARVGPVNPNGSVGDIAGMTDASGRVLGLMPHPDRFLHSTQHPFWTALPEYPEPDGLAIFKQAVAQVR